MKGLEKVGRDRDGVEEDGVGVGWVGVGSKRDNPKGSYRPEGGTPGGILVSTPTQTVDKEVRKVAAPYKEGQGRLSGIWDTLVMGW